MKKTFAKMLSLLLAVALLAGCSFSEGMRDTTQAAETTAVHETTEEAAESTSVPTGETTQAASSEAATTGETSTEAPTTETPVTEAPTTEEPTTEEEKPFATWNDRGKCIVDNTNPSDTRPEAEFTFKEDTVCSLYLQAFGEKTMEAYDNLRKALYAGEDKFYCGDTKSCWQAWSMVRCCIPFAETMTGIYPQVGSLDDVIVDGWCPINYYYDRDEYLKKVDEFKERIAYLIDQADIREGDTDLEKAMKLYTASSVRIVYDYSAIADGYVGALSPYRSLMTDDGICQEIAGAYSYLLLQVGIDAGTAGSITRGEDVQAHEWSMIKLDGTWYYADVTWQVDTPYSLKYFCFTDTERYNDGYNTEMINICSTNELWNRDLPVTDERFEKLRAAAWYMIDHASGKVIFYPESESFVYWDEKCHDKNTSEYVMWERE